jgi:hypothetical protein
MRDNTKAYKPPVKATRTSSRSVLKGSARPGSRNNNTKNPASSVSSANGKTPRPGYKQKSPQAAGAGTLARPGFAQGIGTPRQRGS